jgi:hypothetical protein
VHYWDVKVQINQEHWLTKPSTLMTISKCKSQKVWSQILKSFVNFTETHSSCAQREHAVSFQPCLATELLPVRSSDYHCWVLKTNFHSSMYSTTQKNKSTCYKNCAWISRWLRKYQMTQHVPSTTSSDWVVSTSALYSEGSRFKYWLSWLSLFIVFLTNSGIGSQIRPWLHSFT